MEGEEIRDDFTPGSFDVAKCLSFHFCLGERSLLFDIGCYLYRYASISGLPESPPDEQGFDCSSQRQSTSQSNPQPRDPEQRRA